MMTPSLRKALDQRDAALAMFKQIEAELRRSAVAVMAICHRGNEHEWVWCDYLPQEWLASLPPVMKCVHCKIEFHTWNVPRYDSTAKKVTREELYAMRYPVYIKAEIDVDARKEVRDSERTADASC